MRTYSTARSVLSIVEFIAWGALLTGFFVAVGGAGLGNSALGRSSGWLGALPGLVLMFMGLLFVVFVQMSRAGVDTADYSQQMLQTANEHLKLAKAEHDLRVAPNLVAMASHAPLVVAATAEQAPDPVPDAPENTTDMQDKLATNLLTEINNVEEQTMANQDAAQSKTNKDTLGPHEPSVMVSRSAPQHRPADASQKVEPVLEDFSRDVVRNKTQ